jgi:hypothetical protein
MTSIMVLDMYLQKTKLFYVMLPLFSIKNRLTKKYEGKWLTNGDYAVVHRVAASKLAKGKGIATKLFQKHRRCSCPRKQYLIV